VLETLNQIRKDSLMIDVVDTRIKAFGKTPKANFVSPSEQLITLTIGQLQELVTRAVEKALQPLQDQLSDMEATITGLEAKVTTLESTQDTQAENSFIQLRLIGQLREATKKEPGKTETSRADKIEKYLASRPDHRATFETLKGNLGVDKARLHEAIKTLMKGSPGQYGIIRVPGDKRKRVLVMLPK